MTLATTLPFTQSELALIRQIHDHRTVVLKDKLVKLFTGETSRVYVEGRSDVTTAPQYAQILLRPIVRQLVATNDPRSPVIIGIPTAGTGLAGCVAGSYRIARQNHTIGWQVMRERKKEHGDDADWVSGNPDHNRFRYCTIENTVTSGASLLNALTHLATDGYAPERMVHYVLVDREAGGVDRVRAAGYDVRPIYTLSRILAGFISLGLYSEAQLSQV